MNKNILDSAEDKVQLLLSDIVSEDIDGDPIRFRYLKQQGNLNMTPRRWLGEYLKIMQSGVVVRWQTSREVDPTGGDEVRIWTEDLNGTSLNKECDFTVWDYPDGTLGEDFVKFLTWD